MIRHVLALMLMAAPLRAEGFEPVTERDRFVSLVAERELRLPLWRIRLQVLPDGAITGSALGWEVTGRWQWKDGYFCREMDWSGTPIPYNCQLVEVAGSEKLRFTVDKGAGDAATFRLE